MASQEIATPPRPSMQLVIDGTTYTARCPKTPAWRAADELINRLAAVANAQQRLDTETDMAADVRQQLERTVEAMPNDGEVSAVLVGSPEDTQPRPGGFLRRALGDEQFLAVWQTADDEDTELYESDLHKAAMAVYQEFYSWVAERHRDISLQFGSSDQSQGENAE